MGNPWDEYDRHREMVEQGGRLAPNSYLGRRLAKRVCTKDTDAPESQHGSDEAASSSDSSITSAPNVADSGK